MYIYILCIYVDAISNDWTILYYNVTISISICYSIVVLNDESIEDIQHNCSLYATPTCMDLPQK